MENKNFDTLKLSNKELIGRAKTKLLSIKNIDELYGFYWFKFLNDEIIDLEKWIEDNKPKD